MFSGIQEILLIVLIVAGIFVVPRMMKPRQPAPPRKLQRPALRLSWTLRLAIVLSVLWPIGCILYFKPWLHNATAFAVAVAGIGPVVVGWSLKWVASGMRNRR